MARLTNKQRRFVEEYLIDLSATAAARRAGYSRRTAYSAGQRLLKNVEIQAAIQRAMQQRSRRTETRQDQVIEALSAVAFAEASDCAGSPLRYVNKLRALELLGKHLGMFARDAAGDDEGETGVVVMVPVMTPTEPPQEERAI